MSTTNQETLKRHPARPPRELLSNASHLMKRLAWLVKERMTDAFEPTGLAPYHYAVMLLLDEEPRETQAMIADALGYDRSHLVGLLDELESRGLIERKRDPDDRRRHLVSLTPEGKRTLEELRAIAKRIEDEFFAPLDAGQRELLLSLLLQLASRHDPRYARR
jgi:MarR family transcriptional regulator, lower aerobic nicotinate degradation pathway regulator